MGFDFNSFGSMVFNDRVMQKRLPAKIYACLKESIDDGLSLHPEIADTVADAMKDWAIEMGATHYTHWFQPMTNITAGKHDSFISPQKDGSVMLNFSGKELIKGEPDASSFPSGGLRNTFEARGYTAWDCTSPAFVRDGTLYIPTAFCAYTGEALDTKTPLLRSMSAISKEALKLVRLFGNHTATRVNATVGAEQEYFLVDRDMYESRLDLKICGRTLFGARPPKGQEMDDHYFGRIRLRVSEFMRQLDEELWKLGVSSKTKHNEAAPAQHELAPIFETVNIACDHNQLTMEMMRIIAKKNGLACLLHEKPFALVNGSGKHNNWSISTDDGINLLEPGKTPYENMQFLVVLSSIIKAVDEYADLLRMSAAIAGNDYRLGANEAPPAIVSMFLGDELTSILESIENDSVYDKIEKTKMQIGASVIPHFTKDTTDRNRTSPFAFTGNKFEFRMLGSTFSISGANIVLNTAISEVLCQFADILEKSDDFQTELQKLIKSTIRNHKRIIFNGNNYSNEWVEEAKRRGLLNLKSTAYALPYYKLPKNIELFEKHKIFTKAEVYSRCELLLEGYIKILNIEALTMLEMVKKDIIPAIVSYSKELSDTANSKKAISEDITTEMECEIITKLSKLGAAIYKNTNALDTALLNAKNYGETDECAKYFGEEVFVKMCELRQVVDESETIIASKYLPYPTYGEILFSV